MSERPLERDVTSEEQIARLKRRAHREKTARLEAEKIANTKIVELADVNRNLGKRVASQAAELSLKRAEALAKLDEVNHQIIWEIGDELAAGTNSDVEVVLLSVLEALGRAVGARATAIWELSQANLTARSIARWFDGEERVENAESLPTVDVATILNTFGDGFVPGLTAELPIEQISDFDLTQAPGTMILAGVIEQTGPLVQILPIDYLSSEIESNSSDTNLLRGVMILLRQYYNRLKLQKELSETSQEQQFAHDCLIRNGAALIESTPANREETYNSTLREVGLLLDVSAVVDWQIDYEKECYLRRRFWQHPDDKGGEVPTEINFGSRFMDSMRSSETAQTFHSSEPTFKIPNQLGVARAAAGTRPSALLSVRGLVAGPWKASEVSFVEKISATILSVENCWAAEEMAAVALQSSPVCTSVYKKKDRLKPFSPLNLDFVEGNAAFHDLFGITSEYLLGTEADAYRYNSIDDVPQELRSSYEWMFDEVGVNSMDEGFANDAGTAVITMVMKALDGRPMLLECHNVAVTPLSRDPFLLVHLEDITERRQDERFKEFLVNHDQLTGLLNRRGFIKAAEEGQIASANNSVALIDLDRFKNVNDSLGHDFGDEFLKVVAERLAENLDVGNIVARLGGDEFAVFLRGPIEEAEAGRAVQKLIDKVGEIATIGSHRVYPAMSVGISFGQTDTDVATALTQADAAMYKAKRAGGRRFELFDSGLKAEIDSRRKLETELRDALIADQLEVYYQPEVSLKTGKILGAEALVRWQHPTRGFLAAGQFIELAEETGLATEISRLVLREACAQAATWPRKLRKRIVRVNLTADQVCEDVGLEQEVVEVLQGVALEAENLCLEITESALIKNPERAIDTLARLRDLGVSIALDDFGTGYSSLSYLKRFEVDSLKIDRSFVSDLSTDPESAHFIRVILGLAEGLNLTVVAEGIEIDQEASILKGLGCERAQGFYYYRPMPAAELRGLLEAEDNEVS